MRGHTRFTEDALDSAAHSAQDLETSTWTFLPPTMRLPASCSGHHDTAFPIAHCPRRGLLQRCVQEFRASVSKPYGYSSGTRMQSPQGKAAGGGGCLPHRTPPKSDQHPGPILSSQPQTGNSGSTLGISPSSSNTPEPLPGPWIGGSSHFPASLALSSLCSEAGRPLA